MIFFKEKSNFYLLIKPFVRFCLKHSIKIQEISEMIKQALVEVACEELYGGEQKVSNSKISVITGLQRRDISRILKEENEVSLNNVITKILGKWQIDSDFLNEKGLPKALTSSGRNSEFHKLVTSVSTDINPYAVLFELERLNLIEKTDHEVKMLSRFKELGEQNAKEIINLLSRQLSDLLCAVEENVSKSNPVPNLHLVTEFDNIDPDAVEEIREWILKRGSEFHNDTLVKLAKHDLDLNKELDKNSDKKGVRVSLSGYSKIGSELEQE